MTTPALDTDAQIRRGRSNLTLLFLFVERVRMTLRELGLTSAGDDFGLSGRTPVLRLSDVLDEALPADPDACAAIARLLDLFPEALDGLRRHRVDPLTLPPASLEGLVRFAHAARIAPDLLRIMIEQDRVKFLRFDWSHPQPPRPSTTQRPDVMRSAPRPQPAPYELKSWELEALAVLDQGWAAIAATREALMTPGMVIPTSSRFPMIG